MKILYISPNPNVPLDAKSGAGAHIRGIVDMFVKKGHNVNKIIAGDESKNLSGTERSFHFIKKILRSIVPLMLRKFKQDVLLLLYYAKLFFMIKKQMREMKPDVIYMRSEYLDFTPIFLERFVIPIILEVNGIVWEEMKAFYKRPLWKIGKIIELKKYKIADAIIAIGGLKELIKQFIISEDNIFSVENGVSSDFNVKEGKVKELIKKYKIPEKITVGFVGNIMKWQKTEFLVYSAEEILKKGKDICFLVVGGRTGNKILSKLAKEKNLQEHFIFTGSVNQECVNHLISIMDICIIPGKLPYSSSVKLLNYGLFGKPVVVPSYPYIEELLEDKKEGLLFQPGSISDFSEKILSLIENAELRDYLGKNLQNKVLGNYTWDKIGEKTLEIIRKVMNAKR